VTEIVAIIAAGTTTAFDVTKIIRAIAVTEVTIATHEIIAPINAEDRDS